MVESRWQPSAKVYNERWNPGSKIGVVRDAIEQLPPGGMLVVLGVTWGEYERLLAGLADRSGVRVTFDQGRLQAVSPLRAHEHYAQVMADIALLAAETLDLPFEQLGSTTLRHLERQQGVEPDRCFYIANAARIAGKVTLNLEADPPPDIVVEVDMSSDSQAKLPIYASLGVPEIWLYDGQHVRILELRDDNASYIEILESKFLECLTTAVLDRYLELSKTSGQSEVRRAFRAWLHA